MSATKKMTKHYLNEKQIPEVTGYNYVTCIEEHSYMNILHIENIITV
jgi:hypothetical protein